jgi:hypothetical protein
MFVSRTFILLSLMRLNWLSIETGMKSGERENLVTGMRDAMSGLSKELIRPLT